MTAPPRVVLDTNVVLSALVFGRGRLGAMRLAWQQKKYVPLVSTDTASELIRALAYAKFRLSGAERDELLADYLPWCTTVRMPARPPRTPVCRDPNDQPFLLLALVGKAACLVSGDKDLLAVAPQFRLPIVTAGQFLKGLEDE